MRLAKFCHVVIIVFLSALIICNEPAFASNSPEDKLDQGQNDVELQKQRVEAEIAKLKEEKERLRIENESVGPFERWIATVVGAVGGLAGALVGLFIYLLGRSASKKFDQVQNEKLKQDKEINRETHNLELFRGLADANAGVRLAAASVLIQRLKEFQEKKKERPITPYENLERHTIAHTLLGITKETDAMQPSLLKLIADNLAADAGAFIEWNKEPEKGSQSPLAVFDFQKARLVGAWWKRVDARGLDFFEADLGYVGLAEAYLQEAVLYRARLCGSVLRDADLRDADLREAELTDCDLRGADLGGVKLDGAKYNDKTLWPECFDHKNAGAIFVSSKQ
jgi:hypothetical protein